MIKWLASIEPCSLESISAWRDQLTSEDFCIEVEDLRLRIGLQNEVERLSISVIKTLMAAVSALPAVNEAQLLWYFSGQTVAVANIPKILAAWVQEDDLPMLSIIQLELGDRVHRTCGLTAFAGFECAAHFERSQDFREAAINLGLLARRALLYGVLNPDARYEGFNGCALAIDWPEENGPDAVVTIVLPSDRNGPSFH